MKTVSKNVMFWLMAVLSGFSSAATVPLADKPLASGTSGEVKPNVMIILDDSGSMAWTHLPDHVRDLRTRIGYKSSQCNGAYYNPSITYTPPKRADGTSYPNVDFFNAPYNGFDPNSTKINLSTSFKAYDNTTSFSGGDDTPQAAYYFKYTGSQPAMSYEYNADGSVKTTTTFYTECNSSSSGVFTKVIVPASERQNFANWYSYYRTRLLSAKSALSHALSGLSNPDKIRLGYSTHSYTGTDTNNSEFQKIDDFCASSPGCSQRNEIFNKIFGASAAGDTPLRTALSKAGRIFAGKVGNDPMQYSCQQNFAILATDGFWNRDSEPGYRIDGTTAIGNQDGTAPPPMWDGGVGSKQVDVFQRYQYTSTTTGCTGSRRTVTRQEQRQTVTTPIDPPGAPVTTAWTNYGSAQTLTTCSTSWASFIPTPNPTTPVLLTSDLIPASGGNENSLADVAMYYYKTDLRTPALSNCSGTPVNGVSHDVCENNVPTSQQDPASHQHMTTFTLGLGIDGTLKYCENYDTAGACPDFEALKQGTKIWPNPVDQEDLHRVDDLWHAAVNGRGKYFSAKNPESLASGLVKALAAVEARLASAAAAATSNLEPIAGDNFVYTAMYTTVDWDGEIQARTIDLVTGEVSNNVVWSAQAQLDSKVSAQNDTRMIYFASGGTLKAFTPVNLASYIAAKNFSPGPDNPNGALTQWPNLTAAEQAEASQAAMINYLRGQYQHEDQEGNAWRLFRDRKHALGDVVHGAPVYVKKPQFKYDDPGYAGFIQANANRTGFIYAAANDGMLHAFNAENGQEAWAFVPSAVIPYLYRLADFNYANLHRYFVDGPITVGDVCPTAPTAPCSSSDWRTILVGGLGKGGRDYYALDVTNPNNPQLLWEFSDPNLGYTYGNAKITKLPSGKWVIVVASGYNNVAPGDGRGRLFVLDPMTGQKLTEIVADMSVTDPAKSGLAKISAWTPDPLRNNAAKHVYAGDLDGNVWRFDIEAGAATKLATVGKTAGAPTQPITTKPELAEVVINGIATRVILIGTGKYLHESDISTTALMSVYAIKDDLTNTHGLIRSHPNVVVHNLTGDSTSRNIAYAAMNNNSIGWYMDFDAQLGERVNVDTKYVLGWWVVPGNIPDPNICNVGGKSWLYFLDPWPKTTYTARPENFARIGNSLIVGINIVRLPSGKVVTIITTSDAKYPVAGNPESPTAHRVRRFSWRELVR